MVEGRESKCVRWGVDVATTEMVLAFIGCNFYTLGACTQTAISKQAQINNIIRTGYLIEAVRVRRQVRKGQLRCRAASYYPERGRSEPCAIPGADNR